jgi:hypothetical protein
MNNCPKCYGTGYRYTPCSECHDDGNVWCTVCAGAGKIIESCRCGTRPGMHAEQRSSGKADPYAETAERRYNLMP